MADHDAALAMAGEGQQQQHQQQPDRESSGDNRPSFTEYWREEKQNERAGSVRFVNEGPPLLHQQQHQSSSSLSPSSAMEPPPPKNAADGGDGERKGSCEF
ncbi:hypothetical protein ColLi_06849 [Colletotrichum liriopes]|uniref:Uncharacterized protein n=1 Tax=Colletotrichum liriopes TaxID=708192 RepID=A0AA37LTT8_9PEZI|nr:hypothetical protein ColLi_06849 [Colletotrichum liriopes]